MVQTATRERVVDVAKAERQEKDRLRKAAERAKVAEPERKRRPKEHTLVTDGSTLHAVSRGIGFYLDELADGATEVDDAAVAAKRAKLEALAAAANSSIARLKLRQRIRELGTGVPAKHRDHFVKYAAEWAALNGIDYGTFREMGVSAATLKEAGLKK